MRLTEAPIRVEAEYDDEAHVWVADSEDVPGLVAEHANFDALSNMVVELVPLLLVENGMLSEGDDLQVPIEIIAHAKTRRNALIPA